MPTTAVTSSNRLAHRTFAGVCAWIILCVVGGAALGHKGGRVDPSRPAASAHPFDAPKRATV